MKDRPVVYPRPRPGTRTGRVWEVADEITRETGRRAARREVVERIVTESGNPGTANTQYQYWKASYEASNAPAASDEDLRHVGRQSLTVGSDGRLVIPQEMREHAGLEGRITLVGLGDYIEVWNPERWAAARQAAAEAVAEDDA